MPSKPSSQEINQVTTSIAMTAMMAPDGFGWVKSPYVLLKNPNAPISPFDMPEYHLEDLAVSEELLVQVEVDQAKASEASQNADRYVLLTVLFASVLFFGGISGKFKSQIIDLGMLAMAILMFLVVIAVLISYPVI
jgi:hypothetical protein